MKDYASMSDQELGRLVAAARGMDGGGSYSGATLVVRNGVWDIFDPCNNPADAWPILLDNEISLVKFKGDDVWEAWGSVSSCYGELERAHAEPDENPLRAGMIVFLMMKESEK